MTMFDARQHYTDHKTDYFWFKDARKHWSARESRVEAPDTQVDTPIRVLRTSAEPGQQTKGRHAVWSPSAGGGRSLGPHCEISSLMVNCVQYYTGRYFTNK